MIHHGPAVTRTAGQGRRTNRIAVVLAATSRWKSLPARVRLWDASEGLDPWTRLLMEGCLAGAEATGFEFLWHYWLKEESPEEVARVLAGEADAVVLVVPQAEHLSLLPHLAEQGQPVVIAYAHHAEANVPYVVCDNAGGVAQLVRHLVHLGHERIGYLGGPPAITDIEERRRGFLEGMAEQGLAPDPSLVVGDTMVQIADGHRPFAQALLRREDPPTAVVCATDQLACGLIEGAWELGLNVPRDLAVVGFDDSEEARQTIPQLTTVRQPVAEVASQAWYLAACAVEGTVPETLGWQLRLPVALVVRDSCGAVLAAGETPAGASLGPPTAMRRELELRMRQLAAINQEMQELLYVASHDLRSPLVTIQGFASSLARKYGDSLDARANDYLRRIRNSADTMRELIDALLTLSRSNNEPLRFAPVHMHDLATRVAHDLAGLTQEKQAHLRISRSLPTVLGDELSLYQVLLNLLGNALKFCPEGRTPEIAVGHLAREEEYEFFVRDNGVGIATAYHEEVFQVFRRLGESQAPGSGIGLAIVKRIVLRHGGRVWVESQPGAGTTLRFTLPRRELEHVLGDAEVTSGSFADPRD